MTLSSDYYKNCHNTILCSNNKHEKPTKSEQKQNKQKLTNLIKKDNRSQKKTPKQQIIKTKKTPE